MKEHEVRTDLFVQASRKRKRSASDGDVDEKEEVAKKTVEPPPAGSASGLSAASNRFQRRWADEENIIELGEPREGMGEKREMSSALPVVASAAAGEDIADAATTASRLAAIDADPFVRELVYGMREDVGIYIDRGWNWKIDAARYRVFQARKEAEHQAILDAAPKRDRPDRRPAAAAASRRLMQMAKEEEEVNKQQALRMQVQIRNCSADPDNHCPCVFLSCRCVRQPEVCLTQRTQCRRAMRLRCNARFVRHVRN
jgi:hypothetical protein